MKKLSTKSKKLAAAATLLLLAAVLMTATIVEKFRGTAFVEEHIYSSWPFFALWSTLAATSILYIAAQRRTMRPATLMLHAALVVILLGAAVTWSTAERGEITLSTEAATDRFIDDRGESRTLPFTLRLDEFETVCYDGTRTPMDYVCRMTISRSDGVRQSAEVSMNRILSHEGYRFHLSSFEKSSGEVRLGVTGDRAGIALTYMGYALLLAAILWLMADPRGGFRRLLRHPALKGFSAVALLTMLCFETSAAPESPRVLPRDAAASMGELCVLYNGRLAPLSTLAHDAVRKLSGSDDLFGYTPEQVVSGWIFFYDDWKREEVIRIESPSAHRALGIEGEYARLSDFTGALSQNDRNDRTLREADEKFSIAAMLASGSMLRIFPCRTDNGSTEWFSPVDNLPKSMPADEALFIRRSFDYMGELVARHDYEGVKNVILKMQEWQRQRAGESIPSVARLRAEILYNRTDYTLPSTILLLLVGLASFIIACRTTTSRRSVGRIWRRVSIATTIVILLYLTLRLALRTYVCMHAPLSNGYETMQFMAWCALLLSIVVWRRMPLLLSLGPIVAGMSLAVSMMSGADPSITPLMPVLQSPLLSLHVALVMIAYALLAMVILCGVAGVLLLGRSREESARLQIVSRTMLYPAVMLLAAGIFVGAVWANISWGRYWGWDPKEVWALLTLLIYAAALHSRSIPQLNRPKVFHIYCIAAFMAVIVTYFGVNFLLGGMHSYA